MHLLRKLPILTIAVILPLAPGISHGLDISVEDINPITGNKAASPMLVLRGEIVSGDYDRLLGYAVENNVDLHSISIALATPGGDVSEALKIGQLLKSIYATVSAGPATGPCASACFILFASAVDRSAVPGIVGIHRPYLSKERFQTFSPSQACQPLAPQSEDVIRTAGGPWRRPRRPAGHRRSRHGLRRSGARG